jgi:hypothetical protein
VTYQDLYKGLYYARVRLVLCNDIWAACLPQSLVPHQFTVRVYCSCFLWRKFWRSRSASGGLVAFPLRVCGFCCCNASVLLDASHCLQLPASLLQTMTLRQRNLNRSDPFLARIGRRKTLFAYTVILLLAPYATHVRFQTLVPPLLPRLTCAGTGVANDTKWRRLP